MDGGNQKDKPPPSQSAPDEKVQKQIKKIPKIKHLSRLPHKPLGELTRSLKPFRLIPASEAPAASKNQVDRELRRRGWKINYEDKIGEGGYGTVYSGIRLAKPLSRSKSRSKSRSNSSSSGSNSKSSLRSKSESRSIESKSKSRSKKSKRTVRKEKQVAIKVMDLSMATESYLSVHFPRELYLMRTLKHPNIVHVYSALKIVNSVYVFMELAGGGDLWGYVATHGPLPEANLHLWSKQIIAVIEYLHREGIAHRDIKAENFLMTQFGQLKLTDFGFAVPSLDPTTHQRRRSVSKHAVGTEVYNSPEVRAALPYDPFKMDIYSLGVTLFLMANADLPYDDQKLDEKKFFDNQMSESFEYDPIAGGELSDSFKDLIKILLHPDAKERPTITEVNRHVWFTQDIFDC